MRPVEKRDHIWIITGFFDSTLRAPKYTPMR
jgi:hypothetical protein